MAHAPRYLRHFAHELRREPTREEHLIWLWLRNRRFSGYKFRRQHPVGRYVADFYCPELKLVIEIDGRQHDHPAGADADELRTSALQKFGITVIRVANEELRLHGLVVEQRIEWAIEKLKGLRPSSGLRPPSPRCGGEKEEKD